LKRRLLWMAHCCRNQRVIKFLKCRLLWMAHFPTLQAAWPSVETSELLHY
jgi:hypothetical protein